MKTLMIQEGDLVLSSGTYTDVTGRAKVIQDIRIAMGEPLGVDRFHPRWGSLLPTMVGSKITPEARLRVQTEVQRIISNYISIHRDQISRTHTARQKSQYSLEEIVNSIDEVNIQQDFDRLHVRVVITTTSGHSMSLISTVGA